MLSQSQAQLISGNLDAPRQNPRLSQPAHVASRPMRTRHVTPHEPLVDVDVDPELYMHRRSNLPEALGKFKPARCCGLRLLYANDSWAWYIPSCITFWIVVGNMVTGWSIIGWGSFVVVMVLVTMGFTASYLATCTDPGIYPRLKPGEVDPLGSYENLVYCRVCQLRRPPRTSHCYQCNVCVLQADHHCGVIGGCIGLRSLRWFTMFLVCQSTACCIGVYWMLYLFITAVQEMEQPHSGAARNAVTTTVTELPSYLADVRKGQIARRSAHRNVQSDVDVGIRHVGAVFMVLIDLVVIALVGGLAVVYVYLVASSTTRRESQRRENSLKICCQPSRMLANIIETALPPESLIGEDVPAVTVDVVVEEAEESARLV